MPVYHADKYLRESIESILNQTFGDFEFIIVCDEPSEITKQILDEYAKKDRRIQIYYQQRQGLIVSLNRGISLAHGEYIARMDADDISLPQRFEKQILFLDSNPSIGVVGTYIKNISDDGSGLIPTNVLPTNPNVLRYFLLFFNPVAHPSVMMRRKIFGKFGLYNTDALFAEDYDFWSRIASDVDFSNIPEVLLKYRVHKTSISSEFLNNQSNQACKTQFFLINKLLDGLADQKEVKMLHDWQRHNKIFELSQVDSINSLLHRILQKVLENGLTSSELNQIKYYHLMFMFDLAKSTKGISLIASEKIIFKMLNKDFLMSVNIFSQFFRRKIFKF
jgi:glycosyltransferase involved in cell wall biosynthesis